MFDHFNLDSNHYQSQLCQKGFYETWFMTSICVESMTVKNIHIEGAVI